MPAPSFQRAAKQARRTPFQVAYVPSAQAQVLCRDRRHLLAAVHYTAPGTAPIPGTTAVQAAPLRVPAGCAAVELWHSYEPAQEDHYEGIACRHNDEVLLGALRLPDSGEADLEAAAFTAYTRIYAAARALGYSHLLRIWNYFPRINAVQNQRERYRSFCLGRHRALEAIDTQRLPAASAIGTAGGGFVVYFLAARESGGQVENPRQVSAFRYPRRYSPKSPSFSRAVVKRWGEDLHLYVSGTASIVGHETRHNETRAQLDESLANLDALIGHASDRHGLAIRTTAELSLLKVYVREAEDHELVRAGLERALGRKIPVLLLQGDICRADLRLEIEGLYIGPCDG